MSCLIESIPVLFVWHKLSALNFLSTFQLVIAALKCHKYDKSIQVTGSAALFYLTNTEYRSDQSVRLRREVIEVVLNGMEQYQEVTVRVIIKSVIKRLTFQNLSV